MAPAGYEPARPKAPTLKDGASAFRQGALVLRVRVELTGDGVFETPAYAILLPERNWWAPRNSNPNSPEEKLALQASAASRIGLTPKCKWKAASESNRLTQALQARRSPFAVATYGGRSESRTRTARCTGAGALAGRWAFQCPILP